MTPLRFTYTKISQFSALLPVVSGFSCYKKLNLPFRVLLYFFVVAAGVDIWCVFWTKDNNMYLQHPYVLVEFLGFSLFYCLHFWKNSIIRLFIGLNIIGGIIAAYCDAFYINGLGNPCTLSRSYSSFSIVVYTLLYFYSMFKDVSHYSWESPMFWISTGALIYFGANAFYFMMVKYLLIKAAQVETLSLFFNQGINIIANCIYARAFICFRKWKATL